MKSLTHTCFYLLLLVLCMPGCSRDQQPDPITPGRDSLPPVVPAVNPDTLPVGAFYIDMGGLYRKFDLVDTALIWQISNSNLFGSSGSALVLDSPAFYTGSTAAVAAYNKQSGVTPWLFRWQMWQPSPLQYREPVVNDSVILFTSSTDRSSTPATLYCFNKFTGSQKWTRKVDSSKLYNYYNTTPLLVNNNVVLVSLDVDGHRHLTAYRLSDGTPQWSSVANDNLSPRLSVANGRIYSFANTGVTCYDATNGSEQWRDNLQANVDGQRLAGASIFLENGQAIMVELFDYRYEVHTINPADGRLIKKASVPAPSVGRSATGCIYHDNKLVITSRYTNDTLSVRCYNVSTQSLSWEKRFLHALGTEINMFTPLGTNKFIIFPVIRGRGAGTYLCSLYFLNFDGKEMKRIPYESDINPLRFAYEEKGVIYNQSNRIIFTP